LNPKHIKRSGKRLDYVLAFLPDEALELVATTASSSLSRKRSRKHKPLASSHRAFDFKDILLWIAQRIDIALNIKIDIKAAYKKVYFPIYSLFFPTLQNQSNFSFSFIGGC
jgi:hypothetical protein